MADKADNIVLVTGGAGFIGTYVCRALASHGFAIRVFDNFSTGKAANLEGIELELIEGDILDQTALKSAMQGVDAVIHLAAHVSVAESVTHPEKFHETNVTGTHNVLYAATKAKVRRFVLASSASVYGSPTQMPVREVFELLPPSPYASSKACGEMMLKAFAESFDIETVSLRFFNVYGQGQDPNSPYSGVISIFTDRAKAGKDLTIFGDGSQTRDFVAVEDVAEACVSAIRSDNVGKGEAINIGTGKAVSIRELAEQIQAESLKNSTNWVEVITGPARAGDVQDSRAAVELAEEKLTFTAKTTFDEGLANLSH